MPTSARIVERVTVGSTSACYTILQSSVLVVAPDPVSYAWVPSRIHCSQQFLMAHSERSTWPATRHVDQPAVFIPMIRPLSNSLNCEKCLLARLSGMFRLPKSSYNRRVTVTFMNFRICAGLYSNLFLIVAPPRRREAGWSNRRIGRHLGRSDMVVARCWQQWITEGRVYRRGGSGRSRNTNDREDRAIRRVATSAPTTSLASIQRHLPPSRHPVPSRETIRETTDRSWLEEPTSAKTLTTDPTS
ncbi:uncharacterized protein TNCV_2831011 [Trichonephila clavipes]|nr:uncharacterized protein TNCV_2831011 [Trichonephila clavipes]